MATSATHWTCRICGSNTLSLAAHACCPNCGHERDFDVISEPLAAHAHRFHGASIVCCDQGWSTEARFCGCCGDVLPSVTLIPLDEPLDATFSPRRAPAGQVDLTADLDLLIEALMAGGHVLDVEQECGPPELIEDDEPAEDPLPDDVLALSGATPDEAGGWLIEFDFRSASPSRHVRRGNPIVLDFRIERIDLESVG